MGNTTNLEIMSWNEIDEIARAKKGQQYFSVGDEKTITLDDGEQVTLQILGFDHDDLADGTSKANITFGMENLLATEYKINGSNTSVGGWDACLMRTSTMPMLFNKLPADLQSVIKTVNKKTTTGNMLTDIKISHDKLFLFSLKELTNIASAGYTDEGTQYKYWRDNNTTNDRIKELSNGMGNASWWWLRSPHLYHLGAFCGIRCIGEGAGTGSLNDGGICFGFCV